MEPLFLKEFFFLFPPLVLVIGLACSLLLFPTYGLLYKAAGYPLASQISFYFLLTTFLFLLVFELTALRSTGFLVLLDFSSFYCLYHFLIIFLVILSFFFYLYSPTALAFSANQYELVIFFLLVSLGSLVIVMSNDLMLCYLAIELQSLALYVLASSKTNSTFSTEAGLKYFVLGSFASSVLLFGICLLYGLSGTTSFTNFNLLLGELPSSWNAAVCASLLLLLVGLLFKVGAAPFHFWVPDVYSGVPLPIFAFFSLLPKVAVWGFIIRLVQASYSITYTYFTEVFLIVAFFSFLVGAYGGVIQIGVRRVLAYSAIGQAGYLLLSVSFVSFFTFSSNFFYLLIYSFSLAPLLLILFAISSRGAAGFQFDSIFSFRFLNSHSPFLMFALVVSLFSIAGVPPFSGFFSKIYLFFSALWEGYLYFTLISLFLSSASIVYYLRLIRHLSLVKATKSWVFLQEVNRPFAYIVSALTFVNTIFFFVGGDFLSVLNFFCLTGV